MRSKVTTIDMVIPLFKDGMTIMFGGFLTAGFADTIIDELIAKNIKDITIIANDAGYDKIGIGKLIVNNQVKKIITSYIGMNKRAVDMYNEKMLEVVFVPQGSLAEMVRAGGAGLGGVLTQTGLGTINAEGKQIVMIDGVEFILEKALRADISVIKAQIGDKTGNLVYLGTSRNFNPLMATAADVVIAEVETIKEIGEMDPNFIHTPAAFVDYIIASK